jgi:hypothetical protein
LWDDWALMNRLHCTQSQLSEEDAGNVLIFQAFARGGSEGMKQRSEELAAAKPKR